AFDATSLHGGTVTMVQSGAGMGQFTYNPPPGYEGADSFTYTLTNATGSSTGTVNLTVSGMIWFVDDSAASGGDGRLSAPFNCLTGAGCFSAVNDGTGNHPATGDTIFLYSGSYTGGVTLLNNQKLIGQGASASLASLAGVTVPA